jgi:hypothetical protein
VAALARRATVAGLLLELSEMDGTMFERERERVPTVWAELDWKWVTAFAEVAKLVRSPAERELLDRIGNTYLQRRPGRLQRLQEAMGTSAANRPADRQAGRLSLAAARELQASVEVTL